MKLSTQEEYGLRCLLQIGRHENKTGDGLAIPEISQAEGLSVPNVAKIMRNLRLGELVESVRGKSGGYKLARPADQIVVGEVLAVLGGRFFGPSFCLDHAGLENLCTHSVDCSIRSLWSTVQFVVDQMLDRITLKDLLGEEQELSFCFKGIAHELLQVSNCNKSVTHVTR